MNNNTVNEVKTLVANLGDNVLSDSEAELVYNCIKDVCNQDEMMEIWNMLCACSHEKNIVMLNALAKNDVDKLNSSKEELVSQ